MGTCIHEQTGKHLLGLNNIQHLCVFFIVKVKDIEMYRYKIRLILLLKLAHVSKFRSLESCSIFVWEVLEVSCTGDYLYTHSKQSANSVGNCPDPVKFQLTTQ